VVHLAWLIQPSRDRAVTSSVNVEGSRRVFAAAAAAGVGAVVHASSIGAYSPGPYRARVDESWPTGGIETSFYSRDKAAAERLLDAVEREHPGLRVARLRPGIIMQRDAAEEIRRLFAGPLLPSTLVRPELLPVLPIPRGLRLQVVHADDVADAYRRVVLDARARGAFNVAAEPILDGRTIARALGAVPVPIPANLTRALATATWKARLQPTPPGWFDMALRAPMMRTDRIRALGWRPTVDAVAALRELLQGLKDRADHPTPPLDRRASGRSRAEELRTGVGARTA
jgi:nucleoside-diphosphate-sugar epimerase